ncbi:CRISPR-associated protein Cas4 [Sulfurisphaera tokodaii]|uniref:CRISPR-associated exonuclease Cas4 n=2 Tax=Sulfurisphaera tokodaii TaxID=111955 RepID=Q96XL5_SULTO|nr:CRISPR-associated protein Cas4 [Sulfurisphaera tokodaii]BAB67612.1 putative CRISPR-associated protein Cas4 [Sulfurisphaera tokodaii str. 7]HII75296.1 CRISPR-associated protein Cas4 [Sulfurisphaera tokodaii]
MSNSNSIFINLSLTQTLFRRRFNDKKAHEKKDNNTIYVTDLLYCPLKSRLREQFKELTYAEAYTPSTLQGSLIHDSVERILREELNAEVEVPISKEIKIGDQVYTLIGRADAIKDNAVIEIKTSRNDSGIPRVEHVLQLRIYLNMLNNNPNWDKRLSQNGTRFYGILLYITPDRITEFHIEDGISEDELSELVQDFIYTRITPKHDWECKYCVFAKVCPNKVIINEGKDAS